MDPSVWPLYFQGGKKELMLPFVFFIHCVIRKKPLGWSVSVILILSSSCVQGNLIMLILLCSYFLANSSWCVPLVLLGFRILQPRAGIGQLESAKWGRTWRISEEINHEPAWPVPDWHGSWYSCSVQERKPSEKNPWVLWGMLKFAKQVSAGKDVSLGCQTQQLRAAGSLSVHCSSQGFVWHHYSDLEFYLTSLTSQAGNWDASCWGCPFCGDNLGEPYGNLIAWGKDSGEDQIHAVTSLHFAPDTNIEKSVD